MSTLIQYLQERRPELQTLCLGKTPDEVAGIVQAEFGRLSNIDGDYARNLTIPQARVALSLLDAFRSALTALWAKATSQETLDSSKKDSVERPLLRLEGSLTGAALGGALVGTLVGGAIGGLVVLVGTVAAGTAGGVVVGNVVQFLASRTDVDDAIPDRVETMFQVDLGLLFASLERSFAAIDQVVAQMPTVAANEVKAPTIEDFPEILEFMQDLFGDAQNDDSDAANQLRQSVLTIPAFLRQFGIKVETYQSVDVAPSIQSHFEFEPSLDPRRKMPVMLRPALLRDGHVLRRGRVVSPGA